MARMRAGFRLLDSAHDLWAADAHRHMDAAGPQYSQFHAAGSSGSRCEHRSGARRGAGAGQPHGRTGCRFQSGRGRDSASGVAIAFRHAGNAADSSGDPHGHRRRCASHRVREPGQPASGSSDGAAARVQHSPGAGGQADPAGEATSDGNAPYGAGGLDIRGWSWQAGWEERCAGCSRGLRGR